MPLRTVSEYPDIGDQEGDVGLVWRVVVTVRLEGGVLLDNSFLYLGEGTHRTRKKMARRYLLHGGVDLRVGHL